MRGFTLLEVLMGIAVVGIVFSGLGYASFRDFSRRQRVIAVQRTLMSDLRFAQKDSVSGKKPAGCSGVLNGYEFRQASCSGGSCSQYNINSLCSGNQSVNVKQITLPSNVTVNSVNPFTFKALDQGTSLVTGASVTLTITDSSSGISVAVNISDTGEIK